MKAFVMAILLLFADVISNAQENLLVWNDSIPLQWDDFLGTVNDTSRFDAEAFAEVKYTYKFNSPTNFTFNVKACFDRTTSWIKKEHMSEDLLKHEQAHFAIAQLYACKLKFAFESYRYSSNFHDEVQQIFDRTATEYHKMQVLFDEETSHSLVETKEKEWESHVRDELHSIYRLSMAKVIYL